MTDLSSLFSETHSVKQHSERFLLHDLSSIYFISEGTIDIFAEEKNTHQTGSSIFLQECSEGDFLFSFPTSSHYQIFALADPGTIFHRIERNVLNEKIKQDPNFLLQFLSRFQTWVSRNHAPFLRYGKEKIGLSFFSPEQDLLTFKSNSRISLEHTIGGKEDQLLQWVYIEKGKLRFLNWQNSVAESGQIIPLHEGIYWQAEGEVQLKTVSELELFKEAKWERALSDFHQIILNSLWTSILLEREKEKELFEQKLRLEEKMLSESFEELSFVMGAEKKEEFDVHADTLQKACLLIGRTEKISFSFPKDEENSNNFFKRLSIICRHSAVRYRKVKLTPKWWTFEGDSLLGFKKETLEPVALLKNAKGTYEMVDPSSGAREEISKQNAGQLTSYAFCFYRPLPEGKLDWKEVLKFGFSGEKKGFLKLILVGLGASLLNLFVPFSSKIIMGTIVPELNHTLLWEIGGALFVAVLSSAIFQLTRSFLMLRLTLISGNRIELAQWDRLLRLPVSFFKKFSVGELWNRLFAIPQLRKVFSNAVFSVLLSAIFSLFYIILMLIYSPSLSILGFIVIAICVTFAFFWTRAQFSLQQEVFSKRGKLGGYVLQVIRGIDKLRVTGAEKRAFAYWARHFAGIKHEELKIQKYNVAIYTLASMLPTLSLLSIYSLIIYYVSKDSLQISIGDFFGFIAAYSALTSAALTAIPPITQLVGQLKPNWQLAKTIFEASPEVDLKKKDPGRLQGYVAIDQVYFRYEENTPYVLKNISLKSRNEEFIAVVGPSGCGKSTLIRLLLGFETPEKGTVYYDGNDLQLIDIRKVRRQLGVVLQNGAILGGTIYQNLVFGGFYSKEQLERAIRLSGFEEDLNYFPMGLHTVLSSDGATLSGGQKQRLLIARALLPQPKILLFDEATSALDNKTQDLVAKNIDELSVTRIVIAHRLSTIRHADKIYVMNEGEIIDEGSFDELASRKGLFANILRRQKL